MAEGTVFDHLAIAVHRWSDGYPALVERLGGAWVRGGVTETFSPGQLRFAEEMKIELIAPGATGDDFVARFLTGRGAGPHHITFKVRDMDEFARGAEELGYELMGAHLDIPGRRESLIHPKSNGFGTLFQALEYDEVYDDSPVPDGFPNPSEPAHRIAWVALVVSDLPRALDLFGGVLGGDVDSRGSADDGEWILLTWRPGRRLLLLDGAAAASLGRSGGQPGVDHALVVAHDEPLPTVEAVGMAGEVADAAGLGLPILQVAGARASRVR